MKKNIFVVLLTVCILVCILISLSHADKKEERRRQRQERKRLAASEWKDDFGDEIDGEENSDDSLGNKPSHRDVIKSRGSGNNIGGNRKRQRNERRGKPEMSEFPDMKEKSDDNNKNYSNHANVTTLPETYLGDELLMNGYEGLDKEAHCVDIPRNMSMCQSIGYTKMRLPNLLHHGSLHEVVDGSKSWIPLLRSSCHPDTELFLCSLFSPVCLEQTIFPCRSLCEAVKAGCEGLMIRHGYNWPEMLGCDKLPSDNDLCIVAQSSRNSSSSNSGSSSTTATNKSSSIGYLRGSMSVVNANNSEIYTTRQFNAVITTTETPHNLRYEDQLTEEEFGENSTCAECRQLEKFTELQNKFCAADFVVKMRPSEVLQHGTELIISAHKKLKFLKQPPPGVRWESTSGAKGRTSRKSTRNFYLNNAAQCQCLGLSSYNKEGQYLLMGRLQRSVGHGAGSYRMLLSYVAEYQSPALKRALRGLIRNDRCGEQQQSTAPDHSSSSSSLSSSPSSSSSSLSAGIMSSQPGAKAAEKKTMKVERRRKKLERRLKKIEKQEKKLRKGERNSANDELVNEEKGVKKGADKREMKRRRKKMEKNNRRKNDKAQKELQQIDEQRKSQRKSSRNNL